MEAWTRPEATANKIESKGKKKGIKKEKLGSELPCSDSSMRIIIWAIA